MFRDVKRVSAGRKHKPKLIIAHPDADEVIKTFNTWAYKREQPSDLPLMLRCVAAAIDQQQPIPFVLYWGKGPRAAFAGPERQCLAFLLSMSERIAAAYPAGARFHVVYTDTHARLNQHAAMEIESYHQSLVAAIGSLPATCHRLSALMDASMVQTMQEERPEPDVLALLQVCAAKWYRGEGGALEGAERYFALNMRERRAIETCFPHAIFLTFNGSEYRSLFPDKLPIFYMYSLRKGVSAKPWFLPDTEAHQQGALVMSGPSDNADHARPAR